MATRDSFTNENRLYVDGRQDAVNVVSHASGFDSITAPVTVGWLNDTTTNYHFGGLIDEVAVHDRVLSESFIRRYYTDGTVGLRGGYLGNCGAAIRIMPLGDSITRRLGYRSTLYHNLVDAGHGINFVGSVANASGDYDRDHEAHSGHTPADIANSLSGWLNLNPPEIVLLPIGTNQLDVPGVERILNTIETFDPDITVVLA